MQQTRRRFLALASLSVAPVWATDQSATIIDTHTHFYDPTRPEGVPWPGKNEKLLYRPVLPPEYVKLVAPHGVTGTIVVEASPWLEDNQWVLDLANKHPIIRGVVGSLTPGQEDFRQHLARFAKQPLFRGIRLRDQKLQVADAAWLDDIKRLADAGLSVDVLGGEGLIEPTIALAKAVPTLRIIVDHLPLDQASADDLQRLAAAKNVFVKVSHVLRKKDGALIEDAAHYRPKLEEIWKIFGADRVLYGSNWPVSDLFGPYAKVFGVVRDFVALRSREDSEKYFWKNSQTAYQWKPNT